MYNHFIMRSQLTQLPLKIPMQILTTLSQGQEAHNSTISHLHGSQKLVQNGGGQEEGLRVEVKLGVETGHHGDCVVPVFCTHLQLLQGTHKHNMQP